MKQLLVLIILCLLAAPVVAQVHTEKITRELQFEKKGTANAVMIFNINGDVKVTGYEGDKIIIEVEKVIKAKTEARLEKGKADLRLGVLDRADSIMLFIEGACHNFGQQSRKRHGSRHNGWGYDWDNCCGRGDECRLEYDYEMNFTIKVPMNVHVSASTINGGDVVLENVKGSVLADNVNGSIRLTRISGPTTYASTINGDVDLDYTKNPTGECRFYSLNGDINANFVKGLGAEVAFESFNGNLYTNIDKLETLPATVREASKGDGIKYKIGGNRFKVGTGGALLDFETFNGDAILKEK